MKLVIDAGILFTALSGKGITKSLIFSRFIELFAPEFLLEEIEAHKSKIVEFSKLSLEEIDKLLALLMAKINSVPREEFEAFLEKASSVILDAKDTEYLALSLAKGKMSIWSNDEHFKKQSLSKVFNTKELVEELKSSGIDLE